MRWQHHGILNHRPRISRSQNITEEHGAARREELRTVNNFTSSSLLEATGMDDRNDGNVTYLSLLVFKWAVEQQHARVLDLSPHLGVGYILVEHDAIQDLTKKNHIEVRNGRRTKKPTAADYAMKPHQVSVEYRIETFNI